MNPNGWIMSSSLELELKLAGPPDSLRKLIRLPAIKNRHVGATRTSNLVTAYCDSADHALSARNIAWRIRQSGRHFIHTLKMRGGSAQGALSSAREIALHRPNGTPDRAILDDPSFADDPDLLADLAAIFDRPDFGVIFETHIRRTTYRLALSETAVELAIDLGEIRAGARTCPITEAEFELIAGRDPSLLYDLALASVDQLGLRLEPESKAERGFRLTKNLALTVRKPTPLILAKDAHVDEALRASLAGALRQLLINGKVFEETQAPEAVHQMRVALRRARAAFALFKDLISDDQTDTIKSRLKVLADAMGDCRDLDVFLTEVLPAIAEQFAAETSPEERIDFDPLVKAAERARTAARIQADKVVRAKDYTKLVLDIDRYITTRAWRRGPSVDFGLLDSPITPFARMALDVRRKRAGRSAKDLADLLGDDRHRVRIELKKLRYGGAFFESLFPHKGTKTYLTALSELQDMLGAINDAYVANGLVRRLIAAEPAQSRAEIAFVGGVIVGFNAEHSSRAWDRLVRKWPSFERLHPFWREE
jgi:inorganic triphosphatase YgiF